MSAPTSLPPSLTVEQAGELLGIGRRQTYEAIHRGEVPAIRVGRRLIVPTSRLLELLGLAADDYIRLADPDEAA